MLTLIATGLAAGLPSVDQPVATGLTNTTDAAVVVGIGDYLRVEDVPYAEEDARAFAAFSEATLGIPSRRIWRPARETREGIEAAVAEAGRSVQAGGTVWVYFAGHGAAHPQTRERLLLGDDVTDDGNFAARSMTVTQLEALAGAGGGRVIVVMDVCYTGQFRSLVLDPPNPAGEVIEWSAAQKGQVAAPMPGTEHGAFTWMVLGAFRGWADGEPEVEGAARNAADGVVTAREARDYVERQLAALQVRTQVPQMLAGRGDDARSVRGAGALDGVALVRGAREAPPSLRFAAKARVEGDFAAKLDQLIQEQEQEDAGEMQATRRVAEAVSARQAEARRDWATARAMLDADELSGLAAVELFVDTYQDAHVMVGGQQYTADIPELAEAAAELFGGGAPAPLVDSGTPGFGDEGVELRGGTFQMGSPPREVPTWQARTAAADRQHLVTVSAFVLARTEVSQALWRQVTGANPSVELARSVRLLGDALPVQNVTWCDAVEFANRLSALQHLPLVYSGVEACRTTGGRSVRMDRALPGWRLPTEAEWEFAARAGTTGEFGPISGPNAACAFGNVDDEAAAAGFGWPAAELPCDDRYAGASPVGSFRPNRWGVYDLIGNVSEWVWDWDGDYPAEAVTDPTGPANGLVRITRGPSWSYGDKVEVEAPSTPEDKMAYALATKFIGPPRELRVAHRIRCDGSVQRSTLGVRLARSLPSGAERP